ncbi:cytochrome P450 [Tanacetum coccineum]
MENQITNREPAINSTTFYFTNFPLKWNHLVMIDVFSKYGRVADVYIARKRNKLGKRFGFVRFLDVSNPTRFELRLNTLCIGTQKVFCNIARHQRRPSRANTQTTTKPQSTTIKTQSHQVAPKPSITKPKATSYVDTLTGNTQQPTKHVINIPTATTSSLYQENANSVIIELKSAMGATNTHHLICDEGFEDFSIKYLGGLYLLLNLPDMKTVTNFLINTTFLSHFKSIAPWSKDFCIKDRVTWITISGLPPSLWTPESFNSIANHWGDIIVPEECNPRQFNRSYGRVCILTKHLDTSFVPDDNSLIPIRITETEGDTDSLFNGYTIDSSSDEEDDSEGDEGDEGNDMDSNEDKEYTNGEPENETDDYIPVNNGDLAGLFKKLNSGEIPILGNNGNHNPTDELSVTNSKEGSTSNVSCGVRHKEDNIHSDTFVCLCGSICSCNEVSRSNNDMPELSSHSNEIDNTIVVGDAIGFGMTGKQNDMQNIFTNAVRLHGKVKGYLALLGNWLHIPIPCLFIIVYAPQDQRRKRKLWNDLDQSISAHNSFTIVLGDLMKCEALRNGKEPFLTREEPQDSTTSYRHHASSICQWVPKEYSDNTPILFSNLTADFGATPFKLYNSWITHKDFRRLVNECWNSCNSGLIYNGPCPTSVSFKTKLQQLKSTIKQWRRQVVDMENMVSNDLRLKIDCLDMKVESSFLTDDEILSRTAHVKSLADLENAKNFRS